MDQRRELADVTRETGHGYGRVLNGLAASSASQ